jgi:predicted amidohydrolase YtcJ
MRQLVTRLIPPALVASTLLASACTAEAKVADTIYHGGSILTLTGDSPTYAEALAIKEGKILFVGPKTEALKFKGQNTTVRDLGGKAIVPGFIDAHSHYFSALTVANQVNVYPPPAGPGKDPASIVAELVRFRDANRIPPGSVIQAYGYDENVMPNQVGLTRDDLDGEFPDNPVLVGHVSMHGAVMNSAAMKKWNITAATRTPPGGVIVRKPGSDEPAGLFMETAWLPVFSSLPKPTRQQEVQWSRAGQMVYARAGITTAHEGATHADEL